MQALPDEGVLLQLLVDCHVCLGDAAWADGPSSSSRSSGSDVHLITAQPAALTEPSGSSAQFCQPYKAAAACLTALDLLPMNHRPVASNGSSGSGSCGGSSKGRVTFLQLLLRSGGPLAAEGPPAATAATTAAAAAASTAAVAAGQLRSDIQRRLDAALEQLSDLEQAAVWASTAAARRSNTASKSQQQQQAAGATAACRNVANGRQLAEARVTAAPGGSSGVSGLELACLQVGMQQVDGEMFHKVRLGLEGTLPTTVAV